jgi:hypothetical protein
MEVVVKVVRLLSLIPRDNWLSSPLLCLLNLLNCKMCSGRMLPKLHLDGKSMLLLPTLSSVVVLPLLVVVELVLTVGRLHLLLLTLTRNSHLLFQLNILLPHLRPFVVLEISSVKLELGPPLPLLSPTSLLVVTLVNLVLLLVLKLNPPPLLLTLERVCSSMITPRLSP